MVHEAHRARPIRASPRGYDPRHHAFLRCQRRCPVGRILGGNCDYCTDLNATTVYSPVCTSLSLTTLFEFLDLKNRAA